MPQGQETTIFHSGNIAASTQDVADRTWFKFIYLPGRHDAAEALAESLGGKLVGGYVTTGEYDVVAILDMPEGDAMAKFVLTIGARGQARTKTVRAFPREEIGRIVSELP